MTDADSIEPVGDAVPDQNPKSTLDDRSNPNVVEYAPAELSRWRSLRIAAWIVLGLYLALMLTLTHMPRPPGILENRPDKPLHFTGYFALGLIAFTTAALTFPARSGISLIIVLAGLAFAAFDESTQPLFHRTSDILDWRADAIGLITGVILLGFTRFLLRHRRRRAA
jgi:VanZ family protein